MAPQLRTFLTGTFLLIACLVTNDRSMATTDAPGGRYALVIGNTAYGSNEVSGEADAKAMARALREAKFTVLPLVTDADLETMRAGLRDLEAQISKASVVLVFYSGHGFRVGATSYLFPIGGTVSEDGSMKVEEITEALKSAPADAVKLVFLDACRDIQELKLPPNAETGLAEILNPPQRVLYGFAAEVGRKAISGDSKTISPYTEALVKFIREPGLEIRDFLAQVRAETFRLSDRRQSPADDGIGRMPKEFFLREPVYVNARIDDVDDSMIVFLGSDIILQGSQGDEHTPETKLRLKAGDNVLKLFVSNEKTFRRNQNWERPEGWKYQFQVYPADGQPLLCSEHAMAEGCFSAREEVPFKMGHRHGKLFQVAQVNLFVDPVTAKLTFKDRNDTLWSEKTPDHEKNQGVLFERKLFDLPLARILTDEWAELAVMILQLVAPEPDKIFVTARGNLEAKEEVEACMADEETWIDRLQASISLAMQHDPKPFDPLDNAITTCAQSKDPSLREKGILVYTAVEDRHGEEPEESLVIVGNAAPGREARVASLTDGPPAEGDLRDRLTRMFSPVEPARHQLAAVRASAAQLARLSGRPLLYASVSAADLQAHLPASMEAQFKLARADGTAQVARVELRDQEIVIWTAFEITRPATKLTLQGEAEIHAAAAVERGALVLRPSTETVHFTRAEDDRDVPVPLLAILVRVLLSDVSQALEIQRIPIRVGGVQTFDLAGLLNGVDGVTQVNAQPVDLNVGLGAAALLVDADGVHVLADAVVLTPERFAATVEELRQDLEQNRPPRLTSEQLAVLGECGRSLPLLEPLSQTFTAVCAVFAGLVITEAPTPTETMEEAEKALGQELAAFRKAFQDKADAVEPGLPSARTLVAISRSQIAVAVNEILQDSALQATLRPQGFHGEIPPEQRRIRAPLAPDLHCDQVGGACPSELDLSGFVFQPEGCNSDCIIWKTIFGARIPTVDLGCQAEKAACEARNEARRLSNEGAKAAAQADFALKKAACEAVKAGEQAGCTANQGWLDLVDDQEVGELQGRFDVRDVDLPLTLDQVRVGTDFETIDLRLTAAGRGEISGQLSAQPLNLLGHLVCLAPWETSLTAQVSLPWQQRSLQLRRTGAGLTPDEELRVTYELAETPLQLKIQPPPIQAFLEQNAAKLALSCPVPAFVSGQLLGFPGIGLPITLALRNEILRDTFPFSLPAQEIPIMIPSQTIPVGEGEPIRLVPLWGEKSILFEAR